MILSPFHQESWCLPTLLLVFLMTHWILFISLVLTTPLCVCSPTYEQLTTLSFLFLSSLSSIHLSYICFFPLWLGSTNLKPQATLLISYILGCVDSFTIPHKVTPTLPIYPTLTCLHSMAHSCNSSFPFHYHPPQHELPVIYITLHTFWRTKLSEFLTQFGKIYSICPVTHSI